VAGLAPHGHGQGPSGAELGLPATVDGALDAVRAFRVPLATRFRGVDAREGLVVHGPAGWGEFSPFPEYPPATCARWLAAAEEAATTPWPAPRRLRVPVNVTVPAVPAEDAHRLVTRSGCATAKVKIAPSGATSSRTSDGADRSAEAGDEARVAAVRDALGPAGRLRVDANAAWEPATAARILDRLARYELEYAEQPVATLAELAELRRRTSVPLAVDESIRTADDPVEAARWVRANRAADVVVVKAQPLGGVWPALRVAAAAELPTVVSSAVETSVGLAAGVALAAALPELPHACGLGTAPMLTGDLVDEPLSPEGGQLTVTRPPVSEQAAALHEPPPSEAARLSRRMQTAAAAAGG
jgi:O-succinylbenzoate synthase